MPFYHTKDILFLLNLLGIRGNKHHQARAAHSFWKMSRACCQVVWNSLPWSLVGLCFPAEFPSAEQSHIRFLCIFSTFPLHFVQG